MNSLFDKIDGVKMQIQRKRRQNEYGGMWGSTIDFFNGLQNSNQYGQYNQYDQYQGQNNGWGGQQGWDNNGWGSNMNNQFGGNFLNSGQFGLQMALMANQGLWGNNLNGFDWVLDQCKRQAFDMVSTSNNPNFNIQDIGNILQKQITMIEPSPAEKRLEQLKKQGKAFLDDRFPPNQQSLVGQYGYQSEWAQIKWKRIGQILPNSVIFKDKVEPGDIAQGYLGDCYFLAGLAAIAERPDRIFSLFLLKQTNSVKYFSVKMLYKGKWMTIDMDENIPTLYNKLAFSKAVQNQLWVAILQKAWAKMYTSYKRIEAGYPQQALHDLTGAPIKNIYMKQAGFNKEAEWNYLMMASQKEYAMVASSRPGSDTNKSEAGIVLGHAYTFLNATVLQYQGGQDRIVQMRNPWGKGESKGKWCDDDSNWNLVSPSQKQRIGFNRNATDGIFFMTYDAFIQQFRALTVAQINDNASYIYKSMKDKNIEGVYFKIDILQKGYYSFHVDKTPERSFKDKMQDLYQYPEARIDLGKLNGNSCQKLESLISMKRTLFKGYELGPGTYVAYVKINFNRQFEKDFDVNLAVYSEYACNITIAPKQAVVAYTGNPNVNWNPQAHADDGSDWNPLGNSTYRQNNGGSNNNNGWGNENGGNDNGWGNSNNNSNNGWGESGGNGWNNSNSNNNNSNNNNGWGNDNGWGNSNNTNNNNNSNNGWGESNSSSNNGWGTDVSNNGWGSQPTSNRNNNNNNNNNNGWGW